MAFVYIDSWNMQQVQTQFDKELSTAKTTLQFPYLPKRVQLAYGTHRSIIHCRSAMHDCIPLGTSHHTLRVFLELRRNHAAPTHLLIHHPQDKGHGVSI